MHICILACELLDGRQLLKRRGHVDVWEQRLHFIHAHAAGQQLGDLCEHGGVFRETALIQSCGRFLHSVQRRGSFIRVRAVGLNGGIVSFHSFALSISSCVASRAIFAPEAQSSSLNVP